MFVLVAETAEMGRLRFGCRDDSDRQSWVKWLVRATGQTDKPQNDTQDEQYDGEDWGEEGGGERGGARERGERGEQGRGGERGEQGRGGERGEGEGEGGGRNFLHN